MTIAIGDTIPSGTFRAMGDDGPQEFSSADVFDGRKVALFAVPGAFTPTCSSAHVPSFMRVIGDLKAKGIDEVICLSVNDVFVMKTWGETTGATAAGIRLLCDTDGSFTKALGMDFDGPPVGLLGRSKRYSMVVDNGKVSILNAEASPGECEISAGETLRDQL